MMKMWLSFLLLSILAEAGIYGLDDRQEAFAISVASELKALARSVPAIIEKKVLISRLDGNFTPQGYSLSRMNFCREARFAEQQYVARCSSSLIAPNLVLTAGHCIDEDLPKWCREHTVVFDYAVGLGDKIIDKQNVYECQEVVYRNFAMPFGEDLAIIRLKRNVEDRPLIRVSRDSLAPGQPLSMIGYPLGIPQKVVDDGEVLPGGDTAVSFRHNLDTFSSNSGGPIFAQNGEQVGVLVRATSPNQRNVAGRSCVDWGVARETDYAEGNSLLHLSPVLGTLGISLL